MHSVFWTLMTRLYKVMGKTLNSRRSTIMYAIPTAAAVLCYLNALQGDFVHDDRYAIVDNPDVNGKTGLKQLFHHDFWGKPMWDNSSHKSYRPLCILTFRLDYYLSDGDPWLFHVVNVAMHAAVTLLFVHVLRRVLHVPRAETWLAGLYFAVHPIHTEAVTGIVGRADLLAGLGVLMTVYLYARSLRHRENSIPREDDGAMVRRQSCFWLAMLTGSAAMLCKEHGITCLGVCALLDVLVFSRRPTQRWILERTTTPGLRCLFQRLVAVSFTIVTLLAFRVWINGGPFQLPAFRDEDNPASFSDSLLTRCLTFNYLVAVNAWLLLCPRVLSYDWQVGSVPLVTHLSDVRNLATLAVYGMLVAAACSCLRTSFTKQRHCDDDSDDKNNNNMVRKNAEGDDAGDVLVVSLILMSLPFVPASNLFFRVGFVVAERVLYVPSLGFCLLVASGVVRIWRHTQGRLRKTVPFLTCVLLLLMAMKTWTRNYDWRTRESLFRSGLQTFPTNAKMHYNYANFLKDIGNHSEAAVHYRKAIMLYPSQPSYHNNLGTVLTDPAEAETCYREALRLHPSHRGALVNLGNLLLNRDDVEGEKLLGQALLLDPNYVDALLSLSRLDLTRGHLQQAEEHLKRALAVHPNKPEIYAYYGAMFQKSERYEEALQSYQRALTLDKDNAEAMTNAGVVLTELGRHSEAEQLLKRVVRTKHDTQAMTHLGNLYQRLGRTQDAVDVFGQLVLRVPDDMRVLLKYVQLLMDKGDFKRAESVLTPVLARAPHASNCHVLLALGKVREGLGDKQEALSVLREASRWAGSDLKAAATIHYELGNLLRDLQQLPEALQSYNASVKANPTFVSAHNNLGALYHLLGQYKKAREHYDLVLKLEPSNQLAASNLARLARAEKQKRTSGE